ncbi:MAG TPA: alpha/beta hydrolase [Candidatus Acidoferrum sp.]|nr:alpha/beta hydrolase [Candidatus Acidoferrum sp.]
MSELPFVFLLPGMLCDAEVWHHQMRALAPCCRLSVPSFRSLASFEAMAGRVLGMAPERFSVVAHSMGGRVAMELMRMAPQRIEHFVLMDMGVHPVAEGETERNRRLLELATTGGLEAVADSWIPFMIHPDRYQDLALTAAIRQMVLRNDIADLHNQLLAAERRQDQSQYLSQISHKVHIVCGDSDNWNPPELHQRMHRQLSNSELVILPHCGHMVPMEQPEQVTELLLRWLRE